LLLAFAVIQLLGLSRTARVDELALSGALTETGTVEAATDGSASWEGQCRPHDAHESLASPERRRGPVNPRPGNGEVRRSAPS